MMRRHLIGEIADCIGFLLFMGMLLLGYCLMPHQPSMHSEITYQEGK